MRTWIKTIRTHVKLQACYCILITLDVLRQRQANPWSALASQSSWLETPQQMRDLVSKARWIIPDEWQPRLSSGLHMHTQAHTWWNSVLTSILQVCLLEIWKHFSTWLSPLDQALPTPFYPVSFSSKAIMTAIWRRLLFLFVWIDRFFFFKLPLILFHTPKKKKLIKCVYGEKKSIKFKDRISKI